MFNNISSRDRTPEPVSMGSDETQLPSATANNHPDDTTILNASNAETEANGLTASNGIELRPAAGGESGSQPNTSQGARVPDVPMPALDHGVLASTAGEFIGPVQPAAFAGPPLPDAFNGLSQAWYLDPGVASPPGAISPSQHADTGAQTVANLDRIADLQLDRVGFAHDLVAGQLDVTRDSFHVAAQEIYVAALRSPQEGAAALAAARRRLNLRDQYLVSIIYDRRPTRNIALEAVMQAGLAQGTATREDTEGDTTLHDASDSDRKDGAGSSGADGSAGGNGNGSGNMV